MRHLLFVAVWLQVWTVGLGYPGGAPVARCVDMTPGHGVPAQSDPSPYTIIVSSTNLTNNKEIKVNIKGPEYVGLLLQARSGSNTDPVGTWDTPPTNTMHLACASKEKSAITHSNANIKNSENIYTWIPPESLSSAVISATVVKSRTTFWVNLKSVELTGAPVGGSSATADPRMAAVFLALLVALVFQ